MADEAYRKAVDLLARRPHFEREIRFKLRDRGFVAEETEAAIDRLRRIAYLDDDLCARDFARASSEALPAQAAAAFSRLTESYLRERFGG